MKRLLEALEDIRAAEQEIDAKKSALQADLKAYSQQRADKLEQLKLEKHQLLNQLIEEKERQEKEQLQAEREKLLAEAQMVKQNLQEQYEKHYQQAIGTIIERVKETYGNH